MEPLDIRLADLTGKARIRHAALRLFAANGYAQTSLRAIAHAADVSLALITHHFGSKHQLRDAIDKWVLATFERAAGDALCRHDARAATKAFAVFVEHVGDILRARPEVRAYLRRMAVVDGSPNGANLIGSMLGLIRRVIEHEQPLADERGRSEQSLQWLLLLFGPALLEPVLRRCLPDGAVEAGASARVVPFAAPPGGLAPEARHVAGF